MEYAEIGSTGIKVSRLAFGSWQVSGWATSDVATFERTFNEAIDLGINLIDTAENYGNGLAEEVIGRAAAGCRERLIIATKFSHFNSSPKRLRNSLERSLIRLRTDYIDIYQQHWPPRKPPLEDTITELEKLRSEGKIRVIGVSNWMEPEFKEIDNPSRVQCLQICYNLLWRRIEKSVLPLCREHNIAVLAYSPLCQGLLSGRAELLQEVPNDSRRRNLMFDPARNSAVLDFIKALKNMAAEHNRPAAALAYRWLLDQPAVTAVIVGASNPEQLADNANALGWRLDPKHDAVLSELSAKVEVPVDPHVSIWTWHPRK